MGLFPNKTSITLKRIVPIVRGFNSHAPTPIYEDGSVGVIDLAH